MDLQNKAKILSFVTLVKLKHHNSVVYRRGENKLKRSRDLGIGYDNYKKYLQFLLDNNLTTTNTRGDVIIISMLKVIAWANDGVVKQRNLQFNRFIKFFNYTTYEKISFKAILNKIREELIMRNYSQQQWNIDRNTTLYEGVANCTQAVIKKVRNNAKKNGQNIDKYIDFLAISKDKKVVTGKHHVANIIEMSSSSGSRLIKKLVTESKIHRKIKRVLISTQKHKHFISTFKEMFGEDTIVPFVNGLVYRYIGSEIELPRYHG